MATTDETLAAGTSTSNSTTEATSNVSSNLNSLSTASTSTSTGTTTTSTDSSTTSYNVPTAQEYTPTTTDSSAVYQSVLDNYVSSSSTYEYAYPSITISTTNTNTIEGQYQSAYADAINELAETILNARFSYNPSEDDLLKEAAQYTAQTTMESLNSKGILNSSMTAERVARVIGSLIPEYEQMARDEFDTYFTQLINTANLLMEMDEQQFEYWKDARDQAWEEEQFSYQQEQDAIENAWQRVDELRICG